MLTKIATASPPFVVNQKTAAEELKKRMSGTPAVSRMIDMAASHSGIDKRCLVIPDGDKDAQERFYSVNGEYVSPATSKRMEEYEKWSKQLAKQAVSELFLKSNFNPEKLQRLITVSCTGFFAPGLDYFLINEFNLPPNVKRTNIGFMGCAASITGINSVFEAMKSDSNSDALLVSVELCSLHLQTEPTRDNILANMIFADGCAAALFQNISGENENNLEIIFTETFLFENSADFMGWKIGNSGFQMILSSELPKIILNNATPQLIKILNEKGITKDEIKHWALHPGGRAILDSMQNGLGLTDEQMIPSRTVLKDYGNMSSASILFVLKNILDSGILKRGELCCAVAFGPGLTMEVVLFIVC